MNIDDTVMGNELVLMVGDENSPPNYVQMCSAFDVGAIGEEKPLVDISTLCDLVRKYKGGLPDGLEVPLQANWKVGDAVRQQLYDAYKNDTTVPFRLAMKDVSPTDESLDFTAIVRAWNVGNTQVAARVPVNFTIKINSEVTWAE